MANEIFQSIVLGIVQGITEFLPISSSGHLAILPWIFNFRDPGLAFDVALHAGTLVAVISFFWKDWLSIFARAFSKEEKSKNGYPKNFLWLIIIATIPGVIAGYFLESQAETILRHPLLIAFNLVAAGAFLFLADRLAAHRDDISKLTLRSSLSIGLFQVLALFPGVSRSGATISAGLLAGLTRVGAARFSFLISTPIIFGAAIVKLPEFAKAGFGFPVIFGFAFSAVSGYLAIKYLIKFVERSGYAIFFWYRLFLAAVIAAIYVFK